MRVRGPSASAAVCRMAPRPYGSCWHFAAAQGLLQVGKGLWWTGAGEHRRLPKKKSWPGRSLQSHLRSSPKEPAEIASGLRAKAKSEASVQAKWRPLSGPHCEEHMRLPCALPSRCRASLDGMLKSAPAPLASLAHSMPCSVKTFSDQFSQGPLHVLGEPRHSLLISFFPAALLGRSRFSNSTREIHRLL